MEGGSMSLKGNLYHIIRERDGRPYAYSELQEYCRIWNYKTSNAERRMREILRENDDIEAIKKKNYVWGWRLKKKQKRLF